MSVIARATGPGRDLGSSFTLCSKVGTLDPIRQDMQSAINMLAPRTAAGTFGPRQMTQAATPLSRTSRPSNYRAVISPRRKVLKYVDLLWSE